MHLVEVHVVRFLIFKKCEGNSCLVKELLVVR
jgi:hypothetical protein